MKVVTNSRLMSSRRRMATVLSMGGLAVLTIGLYLSLRHPYLFIYAYAALIVGTILSWVGVTMTDTWIRPPLADQALEKALKRSGRAFTLYNWALPADHVLLSPSGLTVMATFKQEGPVTVKGEKWREERPIARRLFSLGRRPVRNPGKLLELEAAGLEEALAAEDEEFADVAVRKVGVFTYPGVELSVEDPSVPAVTADELKDWLRAQDSPEQLTPARRRRLELLLDRLALERTG